MKYNYNLKRSLYAVAMAMVFTILPQLGKSQVAAYTFSQLSGTYAPVTGGTVLGTGTVDDSSYPAHPIGFTFNYNNASYTTFSVNANGFIALGGSITNSFSAISSGSTNNIVSALNYDLQGTTAGELRYETIGTAPNRVLVVQWSNWGSYWYNSNVGDNFNFQIRLYETTDVVEVVYGSFTDVNTHFAQVGLRGGTNADFNNRTSSTSWAATTAGTLNSNTVSLTSTITPASGLTFRWTPPPPTPMVYVSSTTTQNNTQPVTLSSTNNEIIGVQIVTNGNLSPFALTSLTLNSTGSTNFASDVTNVNVWYTGTSATFATTTFFGSAANLTSPIMGNQTLAVGTNYFWVTYDISPTATIGNVVDAECTSITMSGAGGTQTPSVTAPTGNRMINYCVAPYTIGCSSGDYINNVSTTNGITNFSNLSSGCSGQPNNYMYYSSMNVTCMQTLNFDLTMQSGPSWSQGFMVWIDWNQDGDFLDPGEDVYNSGTSSTAPFTTTITVPATAALGTTRMRVRCSFSSVPTSPCNNQTYGETEDYNLIVMALPPYDAGVQSLSQPLDDNCHGLNETVEVTVKNYGADTIDFALNPMTVHAAASGPNPFTFAPVTVNTGTLLPGATMPVTITTNYNMITPGGYTFTSHTVLTGDGLGMNDTMPSVIRDNTKPTVIASGNVTVCQMDSAQLNVTATTFGYGNQAQELTNANPVNIVDNNTTGTSITVPSSTFTASDLLWVRIDSITHTYTNELSLTLYAPDGTSINLSSNNGGSSDNYINTVFTPTATTPITSGSAPFTGNYLPEIPFSNLGTGPAQGTWQLTVNDNGFGDQGMLWQWTLALPTANGIVSYSWSPSTGLTSDTIASPKASPLTTTTYYVTATDVNGCSNVDTLTVTVNPLPVVALGADTGICVGGSLLLDAGFGGITYLWSDGSTNQTLTVNTPGTYSVEVMDGNVCFNRDTIDIQVYTPVVNLGNDTAICQNSTLLLDAGSGFTSYTWSNMSNSQQINVSSANTYGVAVTDIHGCPAGDTITVTMNALPAVNLGNDTTFCYVNPLTLDAGAGFTYLWSDSTISQTLPVTSTGSYSVTITDANGCQNADTINIIANPTPVVNLGLDIIQCGGNVMLNAGNTGSTYMWSNNATTQFTTVTTSGTYYVDVINSFGCTESDTVQVTIYPNPIPVLGEDTTICAGSTITLNGGAGYASYNWSYSTFSASSQTIMVSPGVTTTYSLTVTDANGCTSPVPSTITVNVEQAPQAAFTTTVSNGVDVLFTNQSVVMLNPTYTWDFGDGSPVDNNIHTAHTYTSNGTYMVTLIVTSTCGSDTIQQALVINGVGIEEAAAAASVINVYPNPNDGIFNLSINGAGNTSLTIDIIDIQGKVVYSERENLIPSEYLKQLNLSGIAKGLYYLRLNTGNEIRMERIVIQ